MALLSDASQKNMSAHQHAPGRSSAYAGTGNDIPSVEYTDVVLNDKTADGTKSVSVSHRATTYILTKPPCNAAGTNNTEIIPVPKVGDKAKVFIIDDANPNVVSGYMEFVYTTSVAADGTPGASSTAKWWRVTFA